MISHVNEEKAFVMQERKNIVKVEHTCGEQDTAHARTLACTSTRRPEAARGNMAARSHPRWRRTDGESIISGDKRFHISNPSRLNKQDVM